MKREGYLSGIVEFTGDFTVFIIYLILFYLHARSSYPLSLLKSPESILQVMFLEFAKDKSSVFSIYTTRFLNGSPYEESPLAGTKIGVYLDELLVVMVLETILFSWRPGTFYTV